MAVDYTPTLGNYTELKPFRYWCQKVLPLVYDDSLSYYELLCKVVDYLNKTMEDVETLHDDVDNLHTAYEELQTYVNEYFDNLDVQEEIDTKLDKMALDGSLSTLVAPFIPDLVAAWLAENISPTTPAIDASLSVSGAGADAKITGENIRYLDSGLDSLVSKNNLFVTPVSLVFNNYYTDEAHADSGYNYYVLTLVAGTAYTCRGVRFISDGSDILLNNQSPEYIATFTPESSGNYYVSVKKAVTITFFTTTAIYTSGDYGTLQEPALAAHLMKQDIGSSLTAVMSQKAITKALSDVDISTHVNLADPEGFTLNYYLGNDGSVAQNSTYFFTDFIETIDSKTLAFSEVRFVTAYDINKSILTTKGRSFDNIDGASFTADSDVAFVRITGKMSNKDSFMVNYGEYLKNYEPYSVITLKEYVVANKRANIGHSLAGSVCYSRTSDALNSGSALSLYDFPKNTKNGVTLTGYCEFSAFTGFAIGKGYNSYRGDWFYIGSTTAQHYKYENSQIFVESKPHNLTISDYIQVCVDIRPNGKAVLSLNTLSGSSQLEFDFTFEQNGVPFLYGSQNITNIKITATATKANSPIWLFGDSYLGYTQDRVMGQLFDLGYSQNIMVDGLAGQGSANAYSELLALLKNENLPKIIIWYLGMNDTDLTYTSYLTKVVNICNTYGITLIINDTPNTPEVDNETKHALVEDYAAAGYRIVNSYQAVGASSDGTWRTGYLAADNVHPTPTGAKALAMALLASVPEITEEF